jgi:amino acid transporter
MGNEVAKKRHGAKDVITKRVGVFSVVGMFYAMCCAGAYGIEEMIPEVGPGLTIVMLIVLPFVWALPYSYICAELGSARPVEGGNIIWVKEALGEFWFGIMVFVNFIWGLVANTVYVVLAVSYLGTMIELNNYQSYAIKIGLILIFFVINVLGVKEVSLVSTILSVAVLIAFMFVAVVGFSHMQSNPFEPFMSSEYDGNVFMTIGAGLAIGIWMYSGFDEISMMAGEIKDSHRVVPRALMIVIPLMVLTYILPTIAGLGSIGEWESWTTEPDGVGYHTVLAMYAPKIFGVIFVVIAIIGQSAIYNMCVAVAGRASMILADEHFGFKILAKLSNKRGTPVVSLVVVAIVTAALLGTPNHPLDFTFLVIIDVFFSVIVCSLTVISALILKRRIPKDEVPFKAPGGIVGHNIMAGLCLFFCVAIVLLNGTDYFLGGYVIMLIIPLIYVICKWIWKGATVNDPQLYPIDPRTKLGFGDVSKLGGYFLGFGIFGEIARFFLSWYESDWGAEYYIEEYESGIFSSFDGMLNLITILGIASAVIGVILIFSGKALKSGDKKATA